MAFVADLIGVNVTGFDLFGMMNGEQHNQNRSSSTQSSIDGMGSSIGCAKSSTDGDDTQVELGNVLDAKSGKSMTGQDPELLDMKEVLKLINDQCKEIERLETEIKTQKEINIELQKNKLEIQMKAAELKLQHENLLESSTELTKKMSSLSCSDPRVENTNDDTSPVRIGKLADTIYASDWFKAYESLYQHIESTECQVLRYLSRILQESYTMCLKKSTTTLRQFLLLPENTDLPKDTEMKQLYQLRRLIYHEKSKRHTIKAELSAEVVKTLEGEQKDTVIKNESLLHYINRCVELCWLAATSSPPLYLEFDVMNKAYIEIKTLFQQYSANESVTCGSQESLGRVAIVVWPAVISEDKASVYMKGQVLVYDRIETHV